MARLMNILLEIQKTSVWITLKEYILHQSNDDHIRIDIWVKIDLISKYCKRGKSIDS